MSALLSTPVLLQQEWIDADWNDTGVGTFQYSRIVGGDLVASPHCGYIVTLAGTGDVSLGYLFTLPSGYLPENDLKIWSYGFNAQFAIDTAGNVSLVTKCTGAGTSSTVTLEGVQFFSPT